MATPDVCGISVVSLSEGVQFAGYTVVRLLGAGGGIIAATWRSTRALQIPVDLRAVVTAETARTGRLIVPAAINDAFERAGGIRAQRAIRACVAAVAGRGAANLAALADAWAAGPPAGAESIAALLQRWRRRDAKLRRGPELGQRRHAVAVGTHRQRSRRRSGGTQHPTPQNTRLANTGRTPR
jgi:hypothetical protein